MKRISKALSLFLTLIMVISIIPMAGITASATTYTGSCGDNLRWYFDDSTGTLTILGTGDMYDYSGSKCPWAKYENDIKDVIIDSGVTSICDYAFEYYFSLTNIFIPDSVTSFGKYALFGCYSLTNITVDSNNQYYSSDEYGVLFNKDKTTLIQYPIGNTRESYTIPYGVITIGEGAFVRSEYLTSIVIPDSVTTIENDAFMECISLTSVTIPNSVTAIGSYAFYSCESLTNVKISNNVTTINDYVFSNCESLTDVTIPNSVTTICNHAFYRCKNLKNITLYDSVTTIGDYAFTSCDYLTDVYYHGTRSQWNEIIFGSYNHSINLATKHYILPSGTCGENLTWTFDDPGTLTISGTGKMEDYNYTNPSWERYSDKITSVVIDDGVTTIGDCAFVNCNNIESVIISDSVTTIGDSAFYACESLTSVTIGAGVTTIKWGAFYSCENLTDVYYSYTAYRWEKIAISSFNDKLLNASIHYKELPSGTCGEGVMWEYDESIGLLSIYGVGAMNDYSLIIDVRPWRSYKNSIKTVAIDNGVTKIGSGVFGNFENLTSVTIPNSVTEIRANAFYNCKSLVSAVIPNSVTTINDSVFEKCESLTNITIPDSVTTIGNYAFSNCENLTNITIPDSVITIGNHAFSNCENLTNITIPDSVTTIGNYAFSNCDSLTSVTIPDSVTAIGNSAFYTCDSLTNITVNSNNQYYSSDEYGVLFNKDKTLLIQYPAGNTRTRYTIPNSVTTIGNSAFFNCDALTNITISDCVTTIGHEVFYHCDSLTSITIPDSVTTIGNYAFYYCTSITNVKISECVTLIDEYTFYNCKSLVSVTIPDSVTTIGHAAFAGCSSLTNITLPDAVNTIGNYAFQYCKSLTSVTIPGNVTKIPEWAFSGCSSLKSIIIGNNVTRIEIGAFYNCTNLKNVYYYGTSAEWKNVKVDSENKYLTKARIYYNYVDPNKFTGIKDNHFYRNDVMQKAYQLVEFEGNFYFIGDRHEIVKNKQVYLNEARINGLTYADGTPIAVGYYDFDENGKMIMRNGIVDNKIYKNNVQLKAYQLVEVDGDFYFIGDRHEIVKNKEIYLNEARINGLTYADGTPIAVGYYKTDADGKLIILDGIVGNKIYKNNVQLKAYQLVEIDGDFYFIGDRHEIVKNKQVYLNKVRINGLTYADGTPISVGYYNTDADGKLIILDGIVGNNIYKNNVQLKAYQLVEVDGDFYFIGDRHEIVKNRKIYLNESRINGLTYADGTPIAVGYYYVDADGKMIIE